jgi:hypothetical protein
MYPWIRPTVTEGEVTGCPQLKRELKPWRMTKSISVPATVQGREGGGGVTTTIVRGELKVACEYIVQMNILQKLRHMITVSNAQCQSAECRTRSRPGCGVLPHALQAHDRGWAAPGLLGISLGPSRPAGAGSPRALLRSPIELERTSV